MSLPPVPTALARPLASVRRFVAPFTERLVELELFDRAVALASQAFVALIPFMVVVAALTPYGERSSFADSIIHRFGLTGDTAAAVEQVFSQSAEVQSALTGFGVLLLIVSALSFCRALQRTYERAWRLQRLGMRSTPSHLLWLAVAAAYASIASALNTAAGEHLGDVGRLVVAFGLSFFLWLWTPYLLLGRRVERHSLRITSALTATALTAFEIASVFYMPRSIASASESFGSIGIAIAIVSWLIGVGFILVVAAGLGAVLAERSPWIRPRALRRRHRGALEREPDQAEREL
jgi:membrane protein